MSLPQTGTVRVDETLPERECDVVMKGGITSGVIYPLAICELASRFRLVNVGGTSAGAIAAAAAAAAELGRRRRHEPGGTAGAGFARLAQLPGELGSRLRGLFQAPGATGPLLRIMLAATRAPARGTGRPDAPAKRAGGKVLRVAAAMLAVRVGWFLFGLAVPLAITAAVLWSAPAPAAVRVLALVLAGVVGLLLGLGLVARSLYRTLSKKVPANYFGICTGMGDESALTPWLTSLLDELSGNDRLPPEQLPADHPTPGGYRPLTFGDLWGEPAVARHRELDATYQPRRPSAAEWAAAQDLRQLNLEMITTDLSRGRPYRLPASERGLMFCPAEMRDLFPERVVSYMVSVSEPGRRRPGGEPLTCPAHKPRRRRAEDSRCAEVLYYLPRPPDLPVVFATRLSLSFPLLMSAVPLYRIDYHLKGRPVVVCWFSDGGITSNFPIHFFDSLLPRRPTFGMTMRSRVPDRHEEDVYLPPAKGEPRRTRWRPITTIAGFGSTIMDTMQNWSDEGQMTVPGFRDRVVHVAMDRADGGMNLDMPAERIDKLARRGHAAAKLLTGDAPAGTGFDWDEHRWTRYRTAMAALEQALARLRATHELPGEAGFGQFLSGFRPTRYLTTDPEGWLRFSRESLSQLLELGRAWEEQPHEHADSAPRPDPELRMTARF